jgi:hypothetical protein
VAEFRGARIGEALHGGAGDGLVVVVQEVAAAQREVPPAPGIGERGVDDAVTLRDDGVVVVAEAVADPARAAADGEAGREAFRDEDVGDPLRDVARALAGAGNDPGAEVLVEVGELRIGVGEIAFEAPAAGGRDGEGEFGALRFLGADLLAEAQAGDGSSVEVSRSCFSRSNTARVASSWPRRKVPLMPASSWRPFCRE